MVAPNDEIKREDKKFYITRYQLPLYRIHELANRYPMMSDEERAELKQSLITIGQQNPITLYKGEIIDGRNRYLILQELYEKRKLIFEPKFREYNGNVADLPKIVEALNVHRRHLSPSQKAAIGVKNHLRIEKDSAKTRQEKGVSLKIGEGGKTSEAIAKIVGVSTTYIEKAMKVRLDDQLFPYLENGKLNIVDAEMIASHATPEQKTEIIEMLKNNITLGLRYRISTIKPRKKQVNKAMTNAERRADEPEFQMPAIIILQKFDLDNDNFQLIKEKIEELNVLLESSDQGKCREIWYTQELDTKHDLKGEIEALHKKWEPTRFQNGEQIWPKIK